MEIYVARQPIFRPDNTVFAYELLYRNNNINVFDFRVASDVATSILIINSYLSFGINKLVGGGKAFINFDRILIEQDIPSLLDRNKVVIEILESVTSDPKFIKKIQQLKDEGYIIALDDFVEGKSNEDIAYIADIIKVDFLENSRAQIEKIVKRWKPRGKVLLAEKVETQKMFEWAKSIGFTLFQGYYFSKPAIIQERSVKSSLFQYVQVIEELNKPEPDFKHIAHLIETDVALTYKLLKLLYINYSMSKKVTTINHGLAMLGIEVSRKWFSLAMVQNLSENKPQELVKLSLVRAKFMEHLAVITNHKAESEGIMLIGILSCIDVLLDKPMDEVLHELPIDEDLKNTLLFKPSKYLDLYLLVLAFEKGEFDTVVLKYTQLHITPKEIPNLYFEAVQWADDIYNRIHSNEDEHEVVAVHHK